MTPDPVRVVRIRGVEDPALDNIFDPDEYDDLLRCTHCGGEGMCWDGSDPLGDCGDDMHDCHACGGSGQRKDQVVF